MHWARRSLALVLTLVGLFSVSVPTATPAGTYRLALPIVTIQDRPYLGLQPWPYDRIGEPAYDAALGWTDAGWARLRIRWLEVEPQNTTPDRFNWSYYDRQLGALAQVGFQIVLTLEDAPAWAADTQRGPLKPGLLAEWLEWTRAVVDRYSKPPYNVHVWEIYNEPDGNSVADTVHLVGGWGEDPLRYAELLKATYPAIKHADPRGQVLISLAYEWFTDDPGGGIFVRDFLDRILDPAQGNAGSAFDLYGLHMYTLFRPIWEPYGRDIIGKTNYIRGVLARYGIQKPMIVSEMGSQSAMGYTREQQARYAIQGPVRSLAAGHALVIWMPVLDYAPNQGAIFDEDLTPRPSASAFRLLSNELRSPVYLGDLASVVRVEGDVEGYFFSTTLGETLVVWVDRSEPIERVIRLPVSQARVVDRFGSVRNLADADDGDVGGSITLTVGQEPLLIRALDGRSLRATAAPR